MLILAAVFVFMPKPVQARIVNTGHQKYKYAEMKKDLAALKKKYGARGLRVNVIGTSPDKRKIYEVVLGNPKAKKHFLVIANLHAREYMTIQLTMRQIEYYMGHYNKKIGGTRVSKTLDRVAIHIIPSANPDGTVISQRGFGGIKSAKLRKALRRMWGSSRTWKSNARGVDLNRNWNSWFRRGGSRGSSGYRGPRAESEPEVKSLVKWVNRLEKQGKICGVVSYHSTGSVIYGRCASQATAAVKKETGKMTSLARRLTGYSLMAVESPSQARGCSREYFLYKRRIPFITIEVGRGSCPLSAGEFSSIWRKNKDLVMMETQLFDGL